MYGLLGLVQNHILLFKLFLIFTLIRKDTQQQIKSIEPTWTFSSEYNNPGNTKLNYGKGFLLNEPVYLLEFNI